MIKNNKFYINNLRDIIILGVSQELEELISVNKHLNLNTTIIKSIIEIPNNITYHTQMIMHHFPQF